jgi:hypothetical protein
MFWGTYDLGKPRLRVLMRGLHENGVQFEECHADIWSGVEDKSQLSGTLPKLKRVINWLLCYPKLIACFIKKPKPDVVFIPYLGQLDVLILWPFARLRGTRIVWDAFISLYNTVVEDRRLISKHNPLAWVIYAFEWLSTRAADLIILDTEAHAGYFSRRYKLPSSKLSSVFVGAEPEQFP